MSYYDAQSPDGGQPPSSRGPSPSLIIGIITAVALLVAVAIVALVLTRNDSGDSSGASSDSSTVVDGTTVTSTRSSESTTSSSEETTEPDSTLPDVPGSTDRGFVDGPQCDQAPELKLAIATKNNKAVVCRSGGTTTIRLSIDGDSVTANFVIEAPSGVYTGQVGAQGYTVSSRSIVVRDGLVEKSRESAEASYRP